MRCGERDRERPTRAFTPLQKQFSDILNPPGIQISKHRGLTPLSRSIMIEERAG